jgi:hypothetical protein
MTGNPMVAFHGKKTFLSSSHLTLTIAIALALALAFTMAVFRSLTFWASSIFIRHINHILPACER